MATLTRRRTFAGKSLSGLASATGFCTQQSVDMKIGLDSSTKHLRSTVGSKNPLLDAGCEHKIVEFRTSLRVTVDYGEEDTVPVAFFQDGKECL